MVGSLGLTSGCTTVVYTRVNLRVYNGGIYQGVQQWCVPRVYSSGVYPGCVPGCVTVYMPPRVYRREERHLRILLLSLPPVSLLVFNSCSSSRFTVGL